MITTSLQRLFECGSWIHQTESFEILMKLQSKDYLSIDDNPITFEHILRNTSLAFAIDCATSCPNYHTKWRSFSTWCCEDLKQYVTLPECLTSLTAAKNYINGTESHERLKEIYEIAYSRHVVEPHKYDTHYYANRAACNAANPDYHTSMYECYCSQSLGLSFLGINDGEIEKRQKEQFLAVTS